MVEIDFLAILSWKFDKFIYCMAPSTDTRFQLLRVISSMAGKSPPKYGAGIYGVPWIPWIYPLYVSIPAPWIRHGIYNIMIYYDYINGNFQPAMFNYRRVWSWRFLKYLEILLLTNSRRFTFDTTVIYYRSKMSQTCCVLVIIENPFRFHRHSAPYWGDLHRLPWVSTQWGAAVGALLGLRLRSLRLRRWCSHCHSYGSCSCGNLHCECRTAGISQWGYQPYHGDIMGIWEEYLIILQHITTYYKMEPKLSMWQNDANITLAKLLEVHGIQLAHLVDSTYRLVDPHVRC